MARMRGGNRVHVFESLSDLQAIQFASRNKIQRPVVHDVSSPPGAGGMPPAMLGRGKSASEGQ